MLIFTVNVILYKYIYVYFDIEKVLVMEKFFKKLVTVLSFLLIVSILLGMVKYPEHKKAGYTN